MASVRSLQHCVDICSAADPAADAVVFGTPWSAGFSHGQLNHPRFACFVHRNGVDTLLICDWGNDRIVEVSAGGEFCRAIAFKKYSRPWGVAYCGTSDVIVVSLSEASAVVLLQYESGAVNVTIGSGCGSGDGQLSSPTGVSFTTDGRYILVADCWNHRASKFSAASGAFITHVISNGISHPSDVLQREDGSMVVAQGYHGCAKVVCVGHDGGTVQIIMIPSQSGGASIPYSLSSSLNGLGVKTFDGTVFLLRDAWMFSTRCAWLSALSCC